MSRPPSSSLHRFPAAPQLWLQQCVSTIGMSSIIPRYAIRFLVESTAHLSEQYLTCILICHCCHSTAEICLLWMFQNLRLPQHWVLMPLVLWMYVQAAWRRNTACSHEKNNVRLFSTSTHQSTLVNNRQGQQCRAGFTWHGPVHTPAIAFPVSISGQPWAAPW